MQRCSVTKAMDILGGKWKAVAIFYLLKGPQRFGELRRLMPGITQRMLTLQLRELERDGLIERKVYAEVPPRVEYSLTELGCTAGPIVQMLCAWGDAHSATVFSIRDSNAA